MARRNSIKNSYESITDIDLASVLDIYSLTDIRRINLSYRRYANLSESEKKILSSTDMVKSSIIGDLTIHLLKRKKWTIKKSIRRATKYVKNGLYGKFLEEFTKFNGNSIPYIKDKYLEKQFIYRGYIPLTRDNYHKYEKKANKYCYITSNRPINGTWYIFPRKYTNNYYLLKRNIPDIHSSFGLIGIPGYTKINYSNSKFISIWN